MPTTITDPFGNVMEVCSISTMVKAQMPKLSFVSEAEWMADVKKGAFYTLRQKIANGELPKNTVIGRDQLGAKMVWKGGNKIEVSIKNNPNTYHFDLSNYEDTTSFADRDWDFGPNMAQMAKQAQAVVDSPAKLKAHIMGDNGPEIGDVVAEVTSKNTGQTFELIFHEIDGDLNPGYLWKKKGVNYKGTPQTHDDFDYLAGNGYWDVEYKVGQTPPLPAAAKLPPVASTSKSVGALTNEEAATMFVKTKDKLALEKGINIKGASGKLDELVYKTIADQAGYTPAEMMAKVEAYKGTGKKLSALKKKVLPKNGNPTKTPTAKAVDNAVQAVKKEEIKPEEVVQVWDDEAVAKAYIKAKDHVVATNDKGWTLYTKNPDFDAEIHKWMQADLGPIKADVADTAIANYIATKQKLSVLKKQMIKKGELNPQADTLKKKKPGGSTADQPVITSPNHLKEYLDNNEVDLDSVVAEFTDFAGDKYTLVYKGKNPFGWPQYEFKYPSGYGSKMSHSELIDVLDTGSYKIEYKIAKPKAAPKETGAGQVGKSTEDPSKIGPAQAAKLTDEVKAQIKEQWESSDLPLSSSGEKLYNSAKVIAKQYGLGEDVLPVLKWVDEYKTAKFGYAPEQNKFLYEKKVLEHLANPKPAYTPPTSSAFTTNNIPLASKVIGEDPPDLSLFKPVSPSEMNELHVNKMGRPTPQQQSALRVYSGSTYHEINGHLRRGGSVEGNTYAKQIQAAMKPMPENVIARRGTSLRGLGLENFEQLENAVGKTFKEPGFSSTAVGGSGQFSGQVNLVIQVPKGAKAVWLKPYSNIQGENELLLAAGTRFRILKVEVKDTTYGGKQNIVHVRVEP